MAKTRLQIIVPLWNEEKNLPALVEMLRNCKLVQDGTAQVILVNNGSTDQSKPLLDRFQSEFPNWLRVHHVAVNQNYGGGVQEGLKVSDADFLSVIPGDLQIQMDDFQRVWQEMQQESQQQKVLAKGQRITRFDSLSMRFVSKTYTFLVNRILGIRVNDINGLPKIFHRSLLPLLASEQMKNFVFDAQLLATAHHQGWKILEVPVTFHARREGVSSWSGKRIRVYVDSFKKLLYLRRHRLVFPKK